MKHIFLFLLVAGFGIFTRAQTQYVVVKNGNHKILKGMISRDLLENDSAFPWFLQNQAGYIPDPELLRTFRNNASKLDFIVFMGTWNPETQYYLPKFFSLLDAAHFPGDRVTLVGMDEDRRSLGDLSETMQVSSIPTIIVMRQGREIGRVEKVHGKESSWDREIGKLLGVVQ